MQRVERYRLITSIRLSILEKDFIQFPKNYSYTHTHTHTHTHTLQSCNYMEQSPSQKVNSHSASQETPCLLWHLKVHYYIHKGSASVSILSQMHPVDNFPAYFPKIHSNIIFPSMPQHSEWSLPFGFPNQNAICISHLSHMCYMSCPSHPP
jgi:hypothetical protein